MAESEMGEKKIRILRKIGIGVLALATASPAFGQGCALCNTAADAAGSRGGRMLDIGILVLLIPCLILFVGIFVMLVRRARAANGYADSFKAASSSSATLSN
jgi:hypothetical protein